jgi:hypothetical protein
MEERAFGLAAAGSCPALLPALCLSPAATGRTSHGGACRSDGQADAGRPGCPKPCANVNCRSRVCLMWSPAPSAMADGWKGWRTRGFPSLTGDRATRIIGALLIVPCLSILVPLAADQHSARHRRCPDCHRVDRARCAVRRSSGFSAGLIWVAILVIGGPALIYLPHQSCAQPRRRGLTPQGPKLAPLL